MKAEPGGGRPPVRTWRWLLLALSLTWLAAQLWAAHATLIATTLPSVAASAAALALPNVVTAALLAGAGAGLVLSGWARRGDGRHAGPRSVGLGVALRRVVPSAVLRRAGLGLAAVNTALGAAGGAVIGILTGAGILLTYGPVSAITVLAVTVAVAGATGGLAAALPAPVLGSGLSGIYAVFAVGVLAQLRQIQSPLKRLLGSGATLASKVAAEDRLVYLTGMLAGVAAASVAYLALRRFARARESGLAWPWYTLAGGLAGLLLLVSYGLVLIGGASLFDRVRSISPLDGVAISIANEARMIQALLVLFVGAVGTTILHGRTLHLAGGPAAG